MGKRVVVWLLCFCMLSVNFCINVFAEERDINQEKEKLTIGEKGGYLASNFKGAKNINNQIKFSYGESGKGFAAEQANNLSDVLHGKNAQIVGGDNIKDGPDRIIINRDGNTTFIQDKYCSTASSSVNSAFDDITGMYRYVDANGKPMQLEVPKGQGKKAIENMEKKIKENRVPGVTDPNEAKNLIKEGTYTFEQATNIAKAGNIDSLVFDAKNGVLISLGAMGITFTLDFASCMINGDDWETALKNASINSLKVGTGVSVIYVISSQLGRTSAPAIFKPVADKLSAVLGEKTSKSLVDLFGYKGQKVTPTSVSGILQSQMLIGTVTVVVFSVPDVIDLFNGRISPKQLGINLAVLIGGTAGATVGTILGGSLAGVPGGLVGGFAGGLLGHFASDTLLTVVFESDAEEMYDIVTKQFSEISEKYLISEKEASNITNKLSNELSTDTLKDMYESEDREKFADKLIISIFEDEIKLREKITMPTQEEVRNKLVSEMEDIVYIH